MARGELMKKLLASYGRDDEFRAVAEQIITEEEKKNNLALAKTLRKTLEGGPSRPSAPKALAPLLPFPEAASDFIERIDPQHTKGDIVLSATNARVLLGLVKEFRRGEDLRRHGLQVRSKVLFCGPPGCGKTLCAEIFAAELGLPFFVVKLDRLISSYLGETASNIRKIFEFARKQPCVLFFDEFDALARARDDSGEHNELRRVVNSLLLFIDQIRPKGFLIAATNLDQSLDPAIWRRFDEVVWFERPDRRMIDRFLRMKFKNVATTFDPTAFISSLEGYSYAEIERVCIQAIKSMIVERRKQVHERDFNRALKDETRRRSNSARLKAGS
ncbi:ATP-binding protein [Rhizobium ruizarguesonis]|jgi:SpoVK/Ycf46/Vps4 family AAA+-type ATPase|uniref:ATP-binding protein n=2 Tax=Rhizobium ruizarguesonis TaxID=2081791 RepID=A0AAE8TYA4_9HYPH|nr:ATP-binding protein [Rhizobium ruizarguesonis]QIO49582.1 ATP-binding protein [Rhizobium leguminosarum bv. trifolii]QJS32570.1 ATP-binding protein [Rhizobium leguminosarum bv. trifolii TA1]TAT70246.1 ATP-binding protein [Rhizobium ruizarguesonis]TAT72486.1 ATP-binding protein [Rhizobium ruizarguesonis]TAT72536.1 ATP-binding protein [Rhizobium ruizarguesonis]